MSDTTTEHLNKLATEIENQQLSGSLAAHFILKSQKAKHQHIKKRQKITTTKNNSLEGKHD